MPNENAALQGKSMHQIGQMLATRDSEIRELKMEVARLRTGALPARHIRDLVLTALLQLKTEIGDNATLAKLINALEAAVDGEVKVPQPPHESKGREYKPLDHGSRE